MTDTDSGSHDKRIDWDDLGRAAERFARRIARDAGKFAERIQEHAGEFAEEVSRDWHHTRRAQPDSSGRSGGPDVRTIFEDVRGVLSDLVDGVDELIERVFKGPAEEGNGEWTRMIINRDATCAGCNRPLRAGEDAHVRRSASGIEARCLTCGEGSRT